MPCRMYFDGENGPFFICARDEAAFEELEKTEACYICGKPATKLCDYSPHVRHFLSDQCNKPMCEEHAHHIDIDTDVCHKHFNELNIRQAKVIRQKLVEYDWPIPVLNIDGDGI